MRTTSVYREVPTIVSMTLDTERSNFLGWFAGLLFGSGLHLQCLLHNPNCNQFRTGTTITIEFTRVMGDVDAGRSRKLRLAIPGNNQETTARKSEERSRNGHRMCRVESPSN